MSTNTNSFKAINPATNSFLEGDFINSSKTDIDTAVTKATQAFQEYRKVTNEKKALFLEQIAIEIENLGDALLNRCHLETALPLGRLQGERGRTMGQLRLFASVVREGSWVDARIDTAQPERTPFPKSDIRHMTIPLGPVAVFGASNFPLAFSTAGGDTASALAAGCPVVYKGHPAHPGTTELITQAIKTAIEKTNMPKGTFSLIQGNTFEIGETLVKSEDIHAVGFTGSYQGGMAIYKYANSRPRPIPVFSEMGSTNPVFILPDALKERGVKIAEAYAGSINLGVGQFCTNPGIAILEKNAENDVFLNTLKHNITETTSGTMLTAGIQSAYKKGVSQLTNNTSVKNIASGNTLTNDNQVKPNVFKTSASNFLKDKTLSEENFGPSSLVIEATDKTELFKIANALEGHLTATVHATEKDLESYSGLFTILEQKVGRVLLNGFPTGVEVCHAMVHGGPFPSTTAPNSTSVGTNAIKRFVRPVCFQDYPDTLLPIELKSNNPLNIWRLVNGDFTKSKI